MDFKLCQSLLVPANYKLYRIGLCFRKPWQNVLNLLKTAQTHAKLHFIDYYSMNNIFWTGYCNNERIIAINEIEKIINSHGFIIDFKQFSDISLSIKIEMEELNIDKLYAALKSYMSLNNFEPLNSSSNRERCVFLNITFNKGTGDLRIEVPAVPG
jgi:hypothetical protein